MGYVWIGCIIAFAVIEMCTVQLISIWFVLGSVAGLIAFLCGANEMAQIAVAVAVSAISLILLRKFVYKVLKPKESKTNVDALIGKELIVDEDINNIINQGSGKINGIAWKLKSESGENIPSGEKVTVKEVRGVTLIVSSAKNEMLVNV